MLEIKSIKKSFGKLEVLKDVSLKVNEGEIVVIVGPSGGGKTTLLRCINMLEKCNYGSIKIDGQYLCEDGTYVDKHIISEIRKKVGMVFQNFNLFPHMTVLQNLIEAPTIVFKEKKEEATKKAESILGFLGLEDKKNCYPYELSGGQKQRVAIGRALALSPKIICFDEPTSALDPSLTSEVSKLIKNLKSEGITTLIITHDMEFAKETADRIISMDKGTIVNRHIYE